MAITVRDVDPNVRKVAGEFELDVTPPTPTGQESVEDRYRATLVGLFRRLAVDEQFDKERAAKGLSPKSEAGQKRRAELVSDLRAWADGAAAATLTAPEAGNRSVIAYGRYAETRDVIESRIFDVEKLPGDGRGKLSEVKVHVRDASDANAPQPSEAEQKLFVRIGETASVLAAACSQLENVVWRKKAAKERAYQLHDEFIDKLKGVAEVGLRGGRAGFAMLGLDNLQNEFVRRVAPRVKNRYMRKLGAWCATFAALNLIAFCLAIYGWPEGWKPQVIEKGFLKIEPAFWEERRAFFLLAGGSCVGAWLSFAVRNVDMSFAQLATPASDLLWPSFRVLFVMGLASIVGLMFWTGAVTLIIGQTSTSLFRTNGSVAILLGAFCGLAERTLADAIKGSAENVAGGVKASSRTAD